MPPAILQPSESTFLSSAAEGYVLHLATGISHGRAVILGVALNLILGTGAVIIAAFMVWGT